MSPKQNPTTILEPPFVETFRGFQDDRGHQARMGNPNFYSYH